AGLLGAGLARLLAEAGHEVGAAVGDGPPLLRPVTTHQPDLAVIDVRMPPTFTDEGVRAAALIRQQDPGVKLLVLSQYVEERYASELIADSPHGRSEEHTLNSSHVSISYAVFCLKKKPM